MINPQGGWTSCLRAGPKGMAGNLDFWRNRKLKVPRKGSLGCGGGQNQGLPAWVLSLHPWFTRLPPCARPTALDDADYLPVKREQDTSSGHSREMKFSEMECQTCKQDAVTWIMGAARTKSCSWFISYQAGLAAFDLESLFDGSRTGMQLATYSWPKNGSLLEKVVFFHWALGHLPSQPDQMHEPWWSMWRQMPLPDCPHIYGSVWDGLSRKGSHLREWLEVFLTWWKLCSWDYTATSSQSSSALSQPHLAKSTFGYNSDCWQRMLWCFFDSIFIDGRNF